MGPLFIGELENLETIKLQDLKHIKLMPDLTKLKNLKKIILNHTGINIADLNKDVQEITTRY